MPDEFEDDSASYDKPPPFFPYKGGELPTEPQEMGEPVEVTIEGVFAAESNGQVQRFVLLTDEINRKLPILIGPFEAQAISLALDGNQPDRPMSHDLMRTIVERLEATLDRIVIDDIWSTTYYAKLYLRKDDEEMEIDSRPSDAIALAVRFECPIFVSEGMLSEVD